MAEGFREYPGSVQAMCAAPWMEAAMRRRAERIAREAIRISPVRTGRYRRRWRVVSGRKNGIAIARVINLSPYAAYLEYGTRYMKAQRILARAIAAARL